MTLVNTPEVIETSGIAHDVNNVLTAITGYAARLVDVLEPGSPELRDAHEIVRAAARGAALARQLLEFGAGQAPRQEKIHLDQLVRGIEGLLPALVGDDVELVISFDPDCAAVRADPARLEQAIVNLVLNACDAMPNGGALSLTTRRLELGPDAALRRGLPAGAYLVLEVADAGIGMDGATASRAFEPFFTTKAPGQGTGLGLATVRATASQSGGTVELESDEGRGTTVRIVLPEIDERS